SLRGRGVEQRQLVGLITRRSEVRILSPQPSNLPAPRLPTSRGSSLSRRPSGLLMIGGTTARLVGEHAEVGLVGRLSRVAPLLLAAVFVAALLPSAASAADRPARSPPTAAPAGPPRPGDVVPGRILVRFDGGASKAQRDRARAALH